MNLLNIILLVLALISGLKVVTIQNELGRYYQTLNQAEKHKMQLEQDYRRLKSEQTAYLSNRELIERIVKQQKLHQPSSSDTQKIEINQKYAD